MVTVNSNAPELIEYLGKKMMAEQLPPGLTFTITGVGRAHVLWNWGWAHALRESGPAPLIAD